MVNEYYLYLYYQEDFIGKYVTKTDDIYLIYKDFGEELIMASMIKNIKLHEQIKDYQHFIKNINKMKSNCEKIRKTDFFIYLSCFTILYKLNQDTIVDYLFIKKKKRSKRTLSQICH